MKDVFISFSSKQTDEAKGIVEYLESNGLTCFISTRDLVAGKEYASQLVDNISSSKTVVLLLSNDSNKSPHVLREIEYAVSHNIPIIVYQLEEVQLSKSLEYFLMTHQWINLNENYREKLLNGIKEILEERTIITDVSKSSPKKKKNPLILIAILTLLIIASATFVLLFFINKKPKREYKLGEEITFGTYLGEDIVWRVLQKDDSTVTLVTKYIITEKVYDAPECGTYNLYDGVDYWTYANHDVRDNDLLIKIRGNNDWETCNLRTWLNSDSEVVDYKDFPPTYKAVGNNSYDTEAGFLTNFTEEEKNAIVPTNHGDYDDLIYILSSDELKFFSIAGMHYYAEPTEAFLKIDENIGYYQSFSELYGTKNYYYWLRDNDGQKASETYIALTEIEEDTKFIPYSVGAYAYGVRPVVKVSAEELTDILKEREP